MHRLHSKGAINRMRFAAVLLCAKCVMFPMAAAVLIYALLFQDRQLLMVAAGAFLLGGLVVIVQWIVSQRTQCPLCMTPVLAKKGCTKHRSAKSFLGSHRLRVALAILLKGSFRCPYCNEPTLMEVRDRSQNRSYSRG